MLFQFSRKLIDDCIKSFKEENEVDISTETANEYLNSFARLYLTLTRIETATPPKLERGGVVLSPLSQISLNKTVETKV